MFLLALFLMLAMFIGINIYNTYMDSKITSEKTIKSTMQCAFSFYVTNLDYADDVLSFDLRTSDEKLLQKMVVIGDNNDTKEIELGSFIGFEQRVSVDGINVADLFVVYPYGCESSNRKECALSTGRCTTA